MTDRWLDILNNGSEHLVFQGPGRNSSMTELSNKINKLQSAIIKSGYRKWVLYDDDGFEFVCAMLALLALGREVLVPASKHKAVIEALLEPDTGLIGAHPEFIESLDVETSNYRGADDPEHDNPVISSGRWGQISFCTSGTSGKPKLITKSAEQLFLEVETLRDKWRPTPNTLFVPLVTHLHIYGLVFAYLLPLLTRSGVYLPRNSGMLSVVEPITPNSSSQIEELIVVTSPTIGRQAAQIKILAEPRSLASDDRLVRISRVYCAGGNLSDVNARQIIELFDCAITEIFGSTETGAVATREHGRQHSQNQNNTWQLLPGLNAIAISGGNDNDPGFGGKGEFSVWGGHVGGSKSKPVLTGDEVVFVDHHQFELIGRSNQVCKIEGKRISLSHLVALLESCQLVSEAVVLPLEKNNKEVLHCGVVLSDQGLLRYQQFGKSDTDQIIRQHLLNFLEPVLVPRSIRYLDEIRRNEMGKVTQKGLRKMLVDPVLLDKPIISNSKVQQDVLFLSLIIPIQLRFLHGHFENRPIVPGFILLHWVYQFIRKYWKCPLNPARVNRLKFSRPIVPGDKLILTLRRTAKGVEFAYRGEQQTPYASGQIPLSPDTNNV